MKSPIATPRDRLALRERHARTLGLDCDHTLDGAGVSAVALPAGGWAYYGRCRDCRALRFVAARGPDAQAGTQAGEGNGDVLHRGGGSRAVASGGGASGMVASTIPPTAPGGQPKR